MSSLDLDKLSHQFMINTINVKAGENIWIEYIGPKAKILADACAKKVKLLGGKPFMINRGSAAMYNELKNFSDKDFARLSAKKLAKMQKMDCYIRVHDSADISKTKLSPELMSKYAEAVRPANLHRTGKTRWLVVMAPTEEFAKDCGMGFSEFQDFYNKVCLADYNAMGEAVKPLQKLMAEGKKVRIISLSQETDITFSIEDIPAVPCTGDVNIPDGECFTAPVKNSINGTIRFEKSISKCGQSFESIKITFENGKAIKAVAENDERTEALNKILDTDEGARYVGEFAINFNPFVLHPTGSVLFDEKISGGLHLAMGRCYGDAPNGNSSAIHWDMVQIQRPEYGGGEIWIDDVLIRKDGIFVLPELEALNPENLKGGNLKPANKGLAL